MTRQAVIDILDCRPHATASRDPLWWRLERVAVSAAVGNSYAARTLDMERLNRVLEVDPIGHAARIQSRRAGPELEAQLRPPWHATPATTRRTSELLPRRGRLDRDACRRPLPPLMTH